MRPSLFSDWQRAQRTSVAPRLSDNEWNGDYHESSHLGSSGQLTLIWKLRHYWTLDFRCDGSPVLEKRTTASAAEAYFTLSMERRLWHRLRSFPKRPCRAASRPSRPFAGDAMNAYFGLKAVKGASAGNLLNRTFLDTGSIEGLEPGC